MVFLIKKKENLIVKLKDSIRIFNCKGVNIIIKFCFIHIFTFNNIVIPNKQKNYYFFIIRPTETISKNTHI